MSFHVFVLLYKHTGCWENTRKSSKPQAGGEWFWNYSRVQRHGNECHIAFIKITEHLPLWKNNLSKWSSFKLSQKLSKRSLISNQRAPQKCWLASEEKCDRNTKISTLFVKEISHSQEWCRRGSDGKVSESNYIVKSQQCLSVEVDVTLFSPCHCKRAAAEINFSFAAARRFAEAYTSFRQLVRCHPFDLFRSWHGASREYLSTFEALLLKSKEPRSAVPKSTKLKCEFWHHTHSMRCS